jgi:hypothetical protein
MSYAQSHTDSLRLLWKNESELDSVRFQALEEYSDINEHVQPDSALASLDCYYNLAQEKNAHRRMYRALNRKANIYRFRG